MVSRCGWSVALVFGDTQLFLGTCYVSFFVGITCLMFLDFFEFVYSRKFEFFFFDFSFFF